MRSLLMLSVWMAVNSGSCCSSNRPLEKPATSTPVGAWKDAQLSLAPRCMKKWRPTCRGGGGGQDGGGGGAW